MGLEGPSLSGTGPWGHGYLLISSFVYVCLHVSTTHLGEVWRAMIILLSLLFSTLSTWVVAVPQ